MDRLHRTMQHFGLLLCLVTALLLHPPASVPAFALPTDGFTLRLVHRDSIESLLYPGNLTATELHDRLMRYTNARLLWIKSYHLSVPLDIHARPKIMQDNWQFYVRLQIGNPRVAVNLLVDTGSDLIWTQSFPCLPCIHQKGPMYKPTLSSTNVEVPCNDRLCKRGHFKCINNKCTYNRRYADASNTSGYLAQESFGIESCRGNQHTIIPGLAFGCSNATRPENFFGKHGIIGGILGMGRGTQSFAVQMADKIDRRFSYCLLPVMNPSSSYLQFGRDIPGSSNVKITAFVQGRIPSYYNLQVIDLSFDGQRLGLAPHAFSGGCAMDSGATYTHLATPVFDEVLKPMETYFSKYPALQRITKPHFELCYKMPEGFNSFPMMSFHFRGVGNEHDVEYKLSEARLFVLFKKDLIFCWGMGRLNTDNTNTSVFGAMQQANMRITYDLARKQLHFSEERCQRA